MGQECWKRDAAILNRGSEKDSLRRWPLSKTWSGEEAGGCGWREEHFRQREQPVQRPWGRSPPCSGRAWPGDSEQGENRRRWGWGNHEGRMTSWDSCKVIGPSEWRRASLENFDWRNSGIWFLSFFFLKYFPFYYYYYLMLIYVFIWLHWSFSCHTRYLCCGSGVSL